MNFENLVTKIQAHADNLPNKICISFENGCSEQHLTYLELDRKAQTLAAYLSEKLAPQSRVLLVYPSNLEFVIAWLGCIYAGMIAVPLMPPTNLMLSDKTSKIVSNAQPSLALICRHLAKDEWFHDVETVCLDEIINNFQCYTSSTHPLDIAFLQYTSGSTGTPKGVMINHQNLADNLVKANQAMDMASNSVLCSWLPTHHDMGLIGFILAPLYGGHRTIIMPPFNFLQNPLFWLQTITKYQANISGGPNFAFDYCVKRIKENKKTGLDLSSWRVAPNGAEPVKASTLERFYQAFKDYGFKKESFYPCYGLAEATLLVASKSSRAQINCLYVDKHELQKHRIKQVPSDNGDAYTLVSSGNLCHDVLIVNPETKVPCNLGEIGEIWISSTSVATGYWQNVKASNESFHIKYHGQEHAASYLRSGDLGFILDNELYVTGRLKDLLIFYGKNYYPQDIEHAITTAPIAKEISRAAAYSIPCQEKEKLGVMIEVRHPLKGSDFFNKLCQQIRQVVMKEHQLEVEDVAFIPVKQLLYTTSGKIRRQACLQGLLNKKLRTVYRWQKDPIGGFDV